MNLKFRDKIEDIILAIILLTGTLLIIIHWK